MSLLGGRGDRRWDDKNGEGGAVREIHGEERGGDDDGGELGELRHGGEEADEVVNVWRGGFRE